MGLGDADLMMMAGAFVGWQVVVVAFFVSVFPGLLFGLVALVRRGGGYLPFGPSLALGVLITVFAWPRLVAAPGPLRFLFFEPVVLGVLAGFGALSLLAISLLLRLTRGRS
jgi:leader peptidase (prepilin peptidase)/N-methyltransferase